MIEIIGMISINLSVLLYAIFYLPQLIHNVRSHKIADLSLGLHALLFISTTADLYYGFGRVDQWQYRLVSVVLFSCLLMQHLQLFVAHKKCKASLQKLTVLSICVGVMLAGLVYTLHSLPLHHPFYVAMGWIERVGYCLYALPQLLKGKKAAGAVSIVFVSIGITTAILDTVSAWIFGWGSPSLYGGIVVAALQIILLWQCLSHSNHLRGNNQAYAQAR